MLSRRLSTMIHRSHSGRIASVQFIVAGTGNWIVPPDVWLISLVCVGAGGNGITSGGAKSGGGGGALAYRNNIPVIPGQVIPYSVCDLVGTAGPNTTTILDVIAGRGTNGVAGAASVGGVASGGIANFNGGIGTSSIIGIRVGGSAATYTANGASNGNAGIGLTGTGSTGTYGRGGTSATIAANRTNGVTGAIRIIWGVGKSYPANAA